MTSRLRTSKKFYHLYVDWYQMIKLPELLLEKDYKVFIDTNIFMHTDGREENNLKELVKRAHPVILAKKNPIIITSKVLEELKKHGAAAVENFIAKDKDEGAFVRAHNAVKFISAAENNGLFRTLGDTSNPYADKTFVAVFQTYGNTYDMCLITNDITLLLLVRELNYQANKTLLAGTITSSGEISIESDRSLLTRGKRKLDKLDEKVIAAGSVDDKMKLEKAELERVLSSLSNLAKIPLSDITVKPYVKATSPTTTPNTPTLANPNVTKPAFMIATRIAASDIVLSAASTPSEGDVVSVCDNAGASTNVKLGSLLGTGGEGSAYSVGSDQVIKIYNREHLTEHRAKKIRLLVEKNLSFKGICFPTGTVLDSRGQFVGYIMPKAEGAEFSKELFSPRRFRKAFPDWKKSDLIDVCIAVLEQISFLHENGIILGDINPKNLLVTKEKDVFIIDADSWQIEGYPCPVGTPMFTAPEIQGKHYPDFLRTLNNEDFAVATLLFQIMITGQFPYARMGFDGDIAKSIKSGLFAFQWQEHSNKDQPKGKWKYMWSHLSPQIKEMFWNTFHKDGTAYTQTKRPSVNRWLTAFLEYKNDIRNSFDPMSNDVYPTRFRMYRSDTPVYTCEKCGNEICGIWQEDNQEYYRPSLCSDCRGTQQKCTRCGRPIKTAGETLCYDCRKKQEYAPCSVCAISTQKPTVERKVSKVPNSNVQRCGAQKPNNDLRNGTCSACRAKENTLDTTRKCTVCGKPFITYVHIWWCQDRYIPIPTSHKRGDSNCISATKTQSMADVHKDSYKKCVSAQPKNVKQNTPDDSSKNSSGCLLWIIVVVVFFISMYFFTNIL